MSSEVASPGVFDDDFAGLFRLSKADLIEAADQPGRCRVRQTGAAYEDTAAHAAGAELAIEWPIGWTPSEPLIETMVVDTASGVCTSMGENDQLNLAWRPAVERFAERMVGLIAAHEIPVTGSAYLTTSLTPAPIVTNTPHFDDNQFVPADGVGLVAILGQLGGPRVARGSLDQPVLASPDEVRLDDEVLTQFTEHRMPVERADPGRIVVFPQFGQLHAGPIVTDHGTDAVRGLLVFRVATTPDGSATPTTAPQRRGRSGRRAR